MNIIEAIRKARELGVNVVSAQGFKYGIDAIRTEVVCVTAGPVDPEYLLTILGRMCRDHLLSDDWEVEKPAEELRLGPEHVGRRVRLRNGEVVLITGCSPSNVIRADGRACSTDGKYWGTMREYDIVEVLD